MDITLKHFGSYGGKAATSIELTVKSNETTILEDVTNMDGSVDESLIQQLEYIVSELKEQNELIKNS